MKYYKLKNILSDLSQTSQLKIVEKLAGNNPKSASLFFYSFGTKISYQAINLIEQTQTYHKRAYDYAKTLDFSITDFKKCVKYVGNVNVVKTKLSSIINETDIIIYWGGAMNCIRQFEGDTEEIYKQIVKEEYSSKDQRDYLEIHSAIRKRMRENLPKTKKILPKNKLEEIISDDLSCLTKNGIFITNKTYDFDRIKNIMKTKGFEGQNYVLDNLDIPLQDYERNITLWKKW